MNYELYTLALELTPGIGRKTIQKFYINNRNHNISSDVFINLMLNHISNIEEVDKILSKAQQILSNSSNKGIKIVSIFNKEFPNKLREIKDFPILIHTIGNYDLLNDDNNLAIIGTREPTQHGINVAKRLSELAVEHGYNVVSGLAIGCDRVAQLHCVNIGGKSIAVMPSGLDTIYPKSNKDLADKIIKTKGCLISEYYYGTKAFPGNYVERDRLQSALSKGVIVVETKIKGGSMHAIKSGISEGRVIGAYYNKKAYINTSNISGNIKLVENNLAIGLDSPENINHFYDKLANFSFNSDVSEQITFSNMKPALNNVLQGKMESNNKKGIIFDLDQTLLDTSRLKKLRNQKNWSKVYDLINKGYVFEYEGMFDIIDSLKNNNITIAIVTNSPRPYCEKILKYFNLDIKYKVCYHDTENIKPNKEPILKAIDLMNIDPKNIISIGDNKDDIISSNSAGIKSIGALWDSVNTEDELILANPNYICKSIKDFENLLRTISFII